MQGPMVNPRASPLQFRRPDVTDGLASPWYSDQTYQPKKKTIKCHLVLFHLFASAISDEIQELISDRE